MRPILNYNGLRNAHPAQQPLFKPMKLLPTLTCAILATSAWAAFTNPFAPPFRGMPGTEFSGWDTFTVYPGQNAPDAPASGDDARVEMLTPGGVLTSTGNLYSPGVAPEFRLTDTVPGDLQEVVLQLSIVNFGNPLDAASPLLSFPGIAAPLPYDTIDYQVGGAGLGEVVLTWNLAANPAVITQYQIDWSAAAANHSLDAVLLDTRFEDDALGSNYCTAGVNSTGQGATISALGSAVVADDDLTLQAGPIGPGQPGIFYYGADQANLPFGNGFRCVAAGGVGIFRLPPAFADLGGVLTQTLDYSAPPTAAGQITAGSTWYFQAWYRDPAGGGSAFNLSDGLEISFL